ncbi:hypothetical protein KW797_00380 [Candidatus Parcubacteria bacterium]|nr:hypothetical protein [Candidatus Parcubacteria bacterium]
MSVAAARTCFVVFLFPYTFTVTPSLFVAESDAGWLRQNVERFLGRSDGGGPHEDTKETDKKKDSEKSDAPPEAVKGETPAPSAPAPGNSATPDGTANPTEPILPAATERNSGTSTDSTGSVGVPNTGRGQISGEATSAAVFQKKAVATSSAAVAPTAPTDHHAPMAAPYHYLALATLTSTELIAAAGAGALGAIAGALLFLRGQRLRRRAEREDERRMAGLSEADEADIERFRAVAGTQRISGIILIAIALGIFLGTAYGEHLKQSSPIVFSKRAMLATLWEDYKQNYIEPESYRTLDRQQENITTSEGESYTMLRAVWQDDKSTFDVSLDWLNAHLKRKDNLFSWLYGRRPNGTLGVVSEKGGANSAADADTDIALALLFAHARWGEARYLDEARAVIASIWEHEVITIKGTPYLAANSVEKTSKSPYVLLNPSYFAPYAYRIFADADPAHPWEKVADSSYAIIDKSLAAPFDKEKSVGLPPNWIYLDRVTGAITASPDSDYGFDAMRVPWRLALDYVWFGEPNAKRTLEKLSFLGKEWDKRERLPMVYAHDGTPVLADESPAFYGGTIGYFKVAEPREAQKIYRDKLEVLYSPDKQGWKEFMSYYDDNWAWFGIALTENALPNLTATLAQSR